MLEVPNLDQEKFSEYKMNVLDSSECASPHDQGKIKTIYFEFRDFFFTPNWTPLDFHKSNQLIHSISQGTLLRVVFLEKSNWRHSWEFMSFECNDLSKILLFIYLFLKYSDRKILLFVFKKSLGIRFLWHRLIVLKISDQST